MTSKQILSTTLSAIRQKKRAKLNADKKAYKMAYAIKGVKKNGNYRKRRKGQESAAPAVNGSLASA